MLRTTSFRACRASLMVTMFALMSVVPSEIRAQASASFSACTQGSLANCSIIRLTSQLGVGIGGTNLFQIALQNLGSQTTPSLATSIYNLVFGTGQPAAPGAEVSAAPAPTVIGSATVTDATEWDLFDSGDAVFLSAIAGNGVGNCVAAPAVGGFGQAGNTCGAGDFLSFSFFTTRAYDPTAFSLLNLEVVALDAQLTADSCNDVTLCTITNIPDPVTATPEPGTLLLAMSGLSGIAGWKYRRRSRAAEV